MSRIRPERDSVERTRAENLKIFRLSLNMTQKQFLDAFLTSDNGEPTMSVATYSNIESKGGTRLMEIIGIICSQLYIDPEMFSLGVKEFTGTLESLASTNEKLNAYLRRDNQNQDATTQLVNRLTMYFADEIMSGRLKRGDQIATDRMLAAQLGVSRSSIREALKVLSILGMIDIRMGQGMYLVGQESQFFSVPLSWSLFLDASQIDEILVVREMLELKSAELAAECQDEILLSKLTAVYHKMYRSYKGQDLASTLELDMEFHSCIAECSGNKIILSMLQTIRNLMHRVSGTGLVDGVQLHDVFSEHRKIYGAIISQNKELAVTMMKEHLANSSHRYAFKAAEDRLPL